MFEELFDDPRWETFGLLREAYRTVSALVDADVRVNGGLPPDLADLLFRLARTPGYTLKTIEITNALATTTTRTTRLVDEAQLRGFVQRRPHPDDRRVTLVRLTDSGLVAAATAGRVALRAAQRHIHDVLDDATIAQLTRSLRQLRDSTHGVHSATGVTRARARPDR